MEREQILNRVNHDGSKITIELFAVDYTFDFKCTQHVVFETTVFELGQNDVDIPIVVDPSTGNIYFMHEERMTFINSSFSQLIETFNFLNNLGSNDPMSDSDRFGFCRNRLLEIDPDSISRSENCWSTVLEEIGYGIV
jgi:hypothetical protein